MATGFSGPYEQSAGVGVSGVYRQFSVPEFAQSPTRRNNKIGKGFSIDALLPLIPGTVKDRADALTVTGSFSSGTGTSDLYTPGTPGNVGFPALPNPTGANPAPVYPRDIDDGLVTYDARGQLHTIDWQMYIVGAQYYVPPSGHVWIGANYGHANSDNAASYGLSPTRIIPTYSFWDAVVFVEVTQPVVVGFEYAQLRQTYADGTNAKNSRAALSTYFIFY